MISKEQLQNAQTTPLRDGFGKALVELARQNEKICAVSADLTASCRMDLLQKEFPDRLIEVGVAEQNLIGVAAGLEHTGMIPFCGSFAAFSPGRNFDQIRVALCYSQRNVKVYGGHAGLTVGEDGATHQMCEDIALMRVLPNMTVFVPCDTQQMHQATLASAKINGPVYIRGSRAKAKNITQDTTFETGKIQALKEGTDLTIIACGIMVQEALQAAYTLEEQGINVSVLNAHTIKPFDRDTLISYANKSKKVLTIEEHQINGGLFGIVCETLAESTIPCYGHGVKDTFGESGKANDLLEKYELTSKHIVSKVKQIVKK